MSRRIVLHKATRIEGNASIQIEIEAGRVRTARFVVPDFRGFETIVKGCPVEQAPGMISRVCGLCSASHQVTSVNALERALGIEPPEALRVLRHLVVLGEWIGSHAFAYFFLATPDMVDAPGGIFELARTHPHLVQEAFALREAGQRVVRALGKRASHPVSLGIGRFLLPPSPQDLVEVRDAARDVRERSRRLIRQALETGRRSEGFAPPPDQDVNLLVHEEGADGTAFAVYGRDGARRMAFAREEFDQNVAEMRAGWSLSKFPYLAAKGFPAGIVLTGPLSRAFGQGGILRDPDVIALGVPERLGDPKGVSLGEIDLCRLAEIHWAAKRIEEHLENARLDGIEVEGDLGASGQGMGVLEAPRGVLVHDYLVDRGRVERLRLTVATQFNNAYMNLLLRDLAEKHVVDGRVSPEGERLIGRCIRTFDPCISCATH